MTSLYIHIPFCKQKCYYCDFSSFTKKNDLIVENYLNYLFKELRFYKNYNFRTVYIGGGTPSILSEKLLEKFLSRLDSWIKDLDEYTIEVNPESVTEKKIGIILEHGINRISIGVQTFSDAVLRSLNRPTRKKDIYKCINLLRDKNFRNYNIDLILGIQSYENYKDDLKKAVGLEPKHISSYILHLSKETKLYEMKLKGEFYPLNEEKLLELYKYSCSYLEKIGYKHYEISNFAKPGFESLHNLNYWFYGDYIGVGLGAVSKLERKRIKNTSLLKEYFLKLDNGALPVANIEYLDDIKQLKEKTMLILRTNRGLSVDRIKECIENINKERVEEFEKFISILVSNYYARVKNGKIILTNKGFLSSNYIISEFFDLLD